MTKHMKFTTLTALLALSGGMVMAEEKTLDIGVTDALTGGAAVYGLPQANAVQMAAEEINAAGGVKVGEDTYMLNVIAYDDKANPTEAIECGAQADRPGRRQIHPRLLLLGRDRRRRLLHRQ